MEFEREYFYVAATIKVEGRKDLSPLVLEAAFEAALRDMTLTYGTVGEPNDFTTVKRVSINDIEASKRD